MHVRVPASSANLGPGFDALGMALSLHAEIGLVDGDPLPPRARLADEHHPATVAFRAAGGQGQIWERCPIPSGRGLGFSGAVRVGGAVLAAAQRHGAEGWQVQHDEVLALVTRLEGHADNVAASLVGGVVVTVAGRVVPVPLGVDPTIVVWVPSFSTSTDESRRTLRRDVAFDDAVATVGRAALFVAALAAGDVAALREACIDRLHQPLRLAAAPACGGALEGALAAGAWAAWLSGSGPTVAAMCGPDAAPAVADGMLAGGAAAMSPPDGATSAISRTTSSGTSPVAPGAAHTKALHIDRRGAAVVAP